MNPGDTKRKQACYSQKKQINFLLEIKETLQVLGLIQEPYSVFISKFQGFEISWGNPSDSEAQNGFGQAPDWRLTSIYTVRSIIILIYH